MSLAGCEDGKFDNASIKSIKSRLTKRTKDEIIAEAIFFQTLCIVTTAIYEFDYDFLD